LNIYVIFFQSIAEVLAAIISLKNIDPLKSLLSFLHARREAINYVKEEHHSREKTLGVTFNCIIEIIGKTIQQVRAVYLKTKDDNHKDFSLLNSCVNSMRQSIVPTLDEDEIAGFDTITNPSLNVITNLYSEKTNAHIIFRYLPLEIRKAIPLEKLEPHSYMLNEKQIQKEMSSWLLIIEKELDRTINEYLSKIKSGRELASLRDHLLNFLEQGGGLHTELDDFKEYWIQVILESFLWRYIYIYIYSFLLVRLFFN